MSLKYPNQIWVNGPVPPSVADISMFRGGKEDENEDERDQSALYFVMPAGKRAIADDGYKGEPTKILITRNEQPRDMKIWIGRVKARQEVLHTRLKSFNILDHRFRHGTSTEDRMDLHQMAVEVVCIVIQYDYENGNPPFEV